MKLLLLTLCFVYAQCRPDLGSPDPITYYDYEKWIIQMERGLKRRFGENYTASPEDACSQACEKPLPLVFMRHLFKDPKVEMIKEFYNKDLLTKICQNANETSTCVKACPDTQRRAFLREVFASIKYLCADSHIVEHADCYRQAFEEAEAGCLSGMCAPKKAALMESINAYNSREAKALQKVSIGNWCDMFRCSILCGDTVRTQKCGAEANQEIHNFYKEIAKSYEVIRFMLTGDYDLDVPQQCKVA